MGEKQEILNPLWDFEVPDQIIGMLDEQIESYAQVRVENAIEKAVDIINKNKSPQSILQGSNTTGVGAISQVYFRKGADWAKEEILKLKNNPNAKR